MPPEWSRGRCARRAGGATRTRGSPRHVRRGPDVPLGQGVGQAQASCRDSLDRRALNRWQARRVPFRATRPGSPRVPLLIVNWCNMTMPPEVGLANRRAGPRRRRDREERAGVPVTRPPRRSPPRRPGRSLQRRASRPGPCHPPSPSPRVLPRRHQGTSSTPTPRPDPRRRSSGLDPVPADRRSADGVPRISPPGVGSRTVGPGAAGIPDAVQLAYSNAPLAPVRGPDRDFHHTGLAIRTFRTAQFRG